jgi:hypothetical protein
MLGLVFGVLVLTFTFSGFASMQPWGWLDVGEKAGAAPGRLAGPPVTWSEAKPALEAQIAALAAERAATALVSFSQLDGQPYFIWRHADGSRRRRGPDGVPAPFDTSAQQRAAELLSGEAGAPRIELLTAPDTYYYPGSAASEFPVVRISVPEMDVTRFYLDAVSGGVRAIADSGAKGFRWWHMALHTFDVIGSPLREALIFLVMLGVTGVCGFGAWLGLRKLARGGKLDNLPDDVPAGSGSAQKGAILS